jgi:hypothetical protein
VLFRSKDKANALQRIKIAISINCYLVTHPTAEFAQTLLRNYQLKDQKLNLFPLEAVRLTLHVVGDGNMALQK